MGKAYLQTQLSSLETAFVIFHGINPILLDLKRSSISKNSSFSTAAILHMLCAVYQSVRCAQEVT